MTRNVKKELVYFGLSAGQLDVDNSGYRFFA